jgi:hypothetical protein
LARRPATDVRQFAGPPRPVGADRPSILSKCLADYAATVQQFRSFRRPPDLTGLKVIALVQDDRTKEVLQAIQFDVEDR